MKISLQKTECAFELENLNALNANVIRFAWFGDFLHIYFGIYVLCLLEFGFKFVTRHTHRRFEDTYEILKKRWVSVSNRLSMICSPFQPMDEAVG